MRFLHISDLHIGKRINEFSMIDDQIYILNKILKIIDNENIDSVIIAGDIYDKYIPTIEAVQVFNNFLSSLSDKNLKVFIVAGNHDSIERLSFAANILCKNNVYISPVYNGFIKPIIISDSFGKINIYMVPFIKPINVRIYHNDDKIINYNDMMNFVIKNMNIDKKDRNILITHQFITGAITSDSEEINVGGSDNIDYNIFDCFDYVALGHIHKSQSIKRETLRYCGTPLKYSLSEINHNKSVTIFDFNEKNNINIYEIPLVPKRDIIKIEGTFDEITSENYLKNVNNSNYFYITIKGDYIIDCINRLRVFYPNIMKLDYKNNQKNNDILLEFDNIEKISPIKLFSEFYQYQNGQDMSEEQYELISKIISDIWEE